MSAYNYITQAEAVQLIADRLFDSGQVFWTYVELCRYLNEALQTWNALTANWRGDFTFSAQQNVTWYDLTDTVAMPNTLRPYTVTDESLYILMQLHLLEPPTGINPWAGTRQFSGSDFLNAVAKRQDEILSITGCTQSRSTIPAVAGRIALADNILNVRRMAYLPSTLFPAQHPSIVWPDDTWAEQSFDRNYTLNPAGTPEQYLMSAQPPISFDTNRPPAFGGNYELLTVNAGLPLMSAMPSPLSIPDDWTHVIKWGALADLLSREWQGKDIPRAEYCEKRYRMGLAAMMSAPALLAMRLNNVPLQIDSIRAADLYNTGWQALASARPTTCLHSGLNLFALTPTPDAGAYSLTATVVQNAPVPALPRNPIQIARGDLDVILDYAQHLAAFKQGGEEFLRTMPLLQRFLKQAANYNGQLLELGEYTSMLLGISQRERDMNPVSTPDAEQEAVS